jgi:hypothetical protein
MKQYKCKIKGWVTSEECFQCFKKQSPKKFGCRPWCKRENVVDTIEMSEDGCDS